jgi:ABC-type dipeptide/oligopeptide/nickel transport system permease subunit
MWHHILPNILSPILVLTTFVIPGVLTAEASLAFLGAGVEPSIPTLGGMIRLAQRVFLIYPHEVLAPVAVLSILTLAFTFVGDGLRDALDPRMGG